MAVVLILSHKAQYSSTAHVHHAMAIVIPIYRFINTE
jgi:hypothetical protein